MQHYSYCRLSPKELLSHAYLSDVSVPACKKVNIVYVGTYKTYLVILLSDEKNYYCEFKILCSKM